MLYIINLSVFNYLILLQINYNSVYLSKYLIYLVYTKFLKTHNNYITFYNYIQLYFYLKFFFKKKIFRNLQEKFTVKTSIIKKTFYKKLKFFFKKKIITFINFENNLNNLLATSYLYKKWRKKDYFKNKKMKKKFSILRIILKKKTNKIFNLKQFMGLKDNNVALKKYSSFSLKQRYFIVKKILIRSLVHYLLINTKKINQFFKYKYFKKKKIFLANIHKKLVWKMHKARITHWNFSTKGQLNKYRYNKLLAGCLNFITINSNQSFLIFLMFSLFSFIASWKQLSILFKKNLIVYNGCFIYKNNNLKIGDIIEFPFGYALINIKKKFNLNKKISKIKKETYKFLKRKRRRTITKKIPKIYKNILFKTSKTLNFIVYDPILNIISIIDNVSNYNYNLHHNLLNKSVIGLQNWRYEFQ